MSTTDPVNVDIAKSSGISIEWKDGHRSEFALQYLRDRCPCATCGKTHEAPAATTSLPGGLQPLPLFKPRLRIQDAETVGRYAIRLFWSDGHSTGIYSYAYLRSLCLCPQCESAKG